MRDCWTENKPDDVMGGSVTESFAGCCISAAAFFAASAQTQYVPSSQKPQRSSGAGESAAWLSIGAREYGLGALLYGVPMALAAAAVGCAEAAVVLLGREARLGWRENMAVKSVSVAAKDREGRARFSSGAAELGEMERIVRLAVRLAVGWGFDTELDLLPASG